MPKFISSIGQNTLNKRDMLAQYAKLAEVPSGSNWDTVSDSMDLPLDYDTSNELHFYNRTINLQYKLDVMFNRLARLSHFQGSTQETLDFFQRNTGQTIGIADGELTALNVARDMGLNLANVVIANYIDTKMGSIPGRFNLDWKTGRNLGARSAVVDNELNATIVAPGLLDPDTRHDILEIQVVNGQNTTNSDIKVGMLNASADDYNNIYNCLRSDSQYYHHPVFLQQGRFGTTAQEVSLELYLELDGTKRSNYVSIYVVEPTRTRVVALLAKSPNGTWDSINFSLSEIGNKKILYFTEHVAMAYRIQLASSNVKEIETSDITTGSTTLPSQDLAGLRFYLSGLSALTTTHDNIIVGRLFDIALNHIAIGLVNSLGVSSVAQSLHIMDGSLDSLYLIQSGSGFLENYVYIECLEADNETIAKTISCPMPVFQDTIPGYYFELLYPKSQHNTGAGIEVVCETTFMPDPNYVFTLGRNGNSISGQYSFNQGKTWSGTIAEAYALFELYKPEKLWIKIADYSQSYLYTGFYKLPSIDLGGFSLDREGLVLYDNGYITFRNLSYRNYRVYLQTILRSLIANPLLAPTTLESSVLIARTNDA